MKTLRIEIKLISSTLTGSGEGFGAIIDNDVICDDTGLPCIPAKRLKGCLKDSAEEVRKMFKDSKIEFKLNIEDTFGKQGEEKSCPVYFSNLMIEDYEANKEWIKYLSNEYKEILSRDIIIDTFTEIRQQTAINEKTGVALPHSLRTIRVIKKGYKFYGDIQVEDEKVIDTLALACINLRRIGTKRNRGYGEVECKLFDGETEISIPEKVEELCKG